MSAKDKKSDIFSYFQKLNVNFLLEVILFLWTKGFQTYLCICVNANVCVFERTNESPHCLLRGLPGQRC